MFEERIKDFLDARREYRAAERAQREYEKVHFKEGQRTASDDPAWMELNCYTLVRDDMLRERFRDLVKESMDG